MAITKDQKNEILNELVDKFGRSKSVVFVDYRGLDVASVSELRGELREKGAECKIAKKTLIKLAAKENKIDNLSSEIMNGPVAATFSYEDELSGLKVLFNFSKKNDNLKLLGGVIDGKVVGTDEINELAKLPSKDELLARLIGSMNAPISGMVGVMNNLVSGFVRVLDAYKNTLPEDGSTAPAEEAPAKEESKAEEAPAQEEEKAAEENAEASSDEEASADNSDDNETKEEEEKPADEATEETSEAKNSSEEEDDTEEETV
jgi:large subunit ribosomal protein L10